MKKLNLKKINISVNTVLQELAEMQFEITDPEDVLIFVNEIAEKTGTIYHFVNDLILEHMTEFPRSFIENWKIYFAEEYGLLGSFLPIPARETIKLVLEDLSKYRSEFVPEEYKLPKKELVEETIPVPFSDLLNKYTPDEIWNIASGKKTDVTEEEIEQAKEVIQRGIVASRLSMRKVAQNKLTIDDLKRFYDLERKGLLTDEFTDDVLSKLLYGLQDYAIGSRMRKGYTKGYISDLEKAYKLSLNEKIIAIDQVVNEFHRDMMPQLMDRAEDPNKVNKAMDDLFYGYEAVLDHARDEIRRLKSEGETPTVENITQYLVTYWSYNVKLNTRVVKELLEGGEIQQGEFEKYHKDEETQEGAVVRVHQLIEEGWGEDDAFITMLEEFNIVEKSMINNIKDELLDEGISITVPTKTVANKLNMRKTAQDSEAPFGSIEYYDYVERRLNRLEEISAEKGLTEKQMKEYDRLVNEKESMEKMWGSKKHSIVDKLNIEKFAQSTFETIQKAQQGDKDAVAKVIEENKGLIAQALIKWGLTPGSDDFQDTLSDIKVEMLNRIIPQYNSSKGAFSTFLTTAVYNFLRRGTRKKKYEEKQKEVSTEEPTGEDITLGESLEDKSHPLVQMTISSARENLQSYLHTKNPELEDMILRIFDLKIEENTHEQIAEFLNKEGFESKGKPITRFIVNNLVNEWIKPALAQFFEAFKTAKLSMKEKVGINPEGPLNYKKITDVLMIVKDLQRVDSLDSNEVEDLAGNLYSIFGDETLSEAILEANEDNTSNFIQIIGEYLASLSTKIELKPRGKELLEDLIKVCQDPDNPKYQIKKVPLKEFFKTKTEEEPEVTEEVRKEKEIQPEKTELSAETISVPYVDLLNKYTENEIWDIASGKKTDVSPEEIEQAKEVIQRGIIANRLSMRKEGSRE